tara:strand:+ start:240 stop:668 length:429 start_codon:yes stop_codon:yes gene_type:complete
MKNLILTFALTILVGFGANAQNAKGDWYVGTGDVANVAWTEWSMTPTLGYGVSDKLMVGLGIAQADSTEDLAIDVHARYFMNAGGQDFFLYAAMSEFETDNLELGLGKMFTFHKDAIFVDPKVVYHTGNKTTNLTLGLGLRF